MDILSDKTLITRKAHNCSACGRVFPKGVKMRTQVNTFDGIGTWRTCETCTTLLNEFPDCFDDGYGMFMGNCVDESLNRDQTPEQLLDELRAKK